VVKLPERSVNPSSEPLTAADMRSHLRLTQTDDDPNIEKYITAAREYLEDIHGISFFTTTWKAYYSSFGSTLEIPRRPVQSITSLAYTDEDGNSQTLTENTDFIVDYKSVIPTIKEAENVTWPTDVEDDIYNPIILTFIAGYATVATIPTPWVQALRLMVELMAERYGPLTEKAYSDLPLNNVHAMLGAYAGPLI